MEGAWKETLKRDIERKSNGGNDAAPFAPWVSVLGCV